MAISEFHEDNTIATYAQLSKMSKGFSNHYMETFADVSIRRTLRKYRWLIELSRKHSIQTLLLQGITDFLDKVPSLRKEGEPLSIGLVLKNKKLKLEDPLIERKSFHISKFSNFFHLKNIVDGSTLCYVVDEKGMITIRQIPQKMLGKTCHSTLLNISQMFQTVAFCIDSSSSEIYDSGRVVRINRKGVWMKPCVMPLKKLDREGFPLGLLQLIFHFCLELSERNKGSTFVIIKDDCLKHCSSMNKEYRFKKCRIDQIPKNQIINFASLDGALILNTKYELINIGQKLEPPLSTKYSRESGRGTRHNCAAMYSNAVESVVFVVSEDGPISLYFKGARYARCFDELFGAP